MTTGTEIWKLADGQVMIGVHPDGTCATNRCVIHNPSDHPLRGGPFRQRADGSLENLCRHQLGHPNPDDLASRAALGLRANPVHSCDGCCAARTEA